MVGSLHDEPGSPWLSSVVGIKGVDVAHLMGMNGAAAGQTSTKFSPPPSCGGCVQGCVQVPGSRVQGVAAWRSRRGGRVGILGNEQPGVGLCRPTGSGSSKRN